MVASATGYRNKSFERRLIAIMQTLVIPLSLAGNLLCRWFAAALRGAPPFHLPLPRVMAEGVCHHCVLVDNLRNLRSSHGWHQAAVATRNWHLVDQATVLML